jgi:hypothetical protein
MIFKLFAETELFTAARSVNCACYLLGQPLCSVFCRSLSNNTCKPVFESNYLLDCASLS